MLDGERQVSLRFELGFLMRERKAVESRGQSNYGRKDTRHEVAFSILVFVISAHSLTEQHVSLDRGDFIPGSR